MYAKQIVSKIQANEFGNRSNTRNILIMANQAGYEYDIAEIVIEVLAIYGLDEASLTSAAKRVGQLVMQKMNIEHYFDTDTTGHKEAKVIKLGADLIDMGAELGYCAAVKRGTASEAPWILTLLDDFYEWAASVHPKKVQPPIGDEPYQWTSQTLYYGEGQEIHIVKKAKQNGMLHHYKFDESNAEWYKAINRLNRQGFVVCKELLEIAEAGHPFLDEVVEGKAFNKKVIASKSKVTAQSRVLRMARERLGKTSYWLHQLDTRGRAYTVQSGLSPMGTDLSKALLEYDVPKQIDLFHFKWQCANHFGEDKLSFNDRVAWFDSEADAIYEIGCGVYNELMEAVSNEKKSKWQALRFAMEWVRLKETYG